jgi:hypothetical protein
MCRKDVCAHLAANVVIHLSMLNEENGVLVDRIDEQESKHDEELEKIGKRMKKDCRELVAKYSRAPPLDFMCYVIGRGRHWSSGVFYTHVCGYALMLSIHFDEENQLFQCKYMFVGHECVCPPFRVTGTIEGRGTRIVDHLVRDRSEVFGFNCGVSPFRFKIAKIEILDEDVEEDEGDFEEEIEEGEEKEGGVGEEEKEEEVEEEMKDDSGNHAGD